MKTISGIRNDVYHVWLCVQRIKSLVEREAFKIIYESSSEEEQEYVNRLIDGLRHDELLSWAKNTKKARYQLYSLTELRLYAASIYVKYVNFKTKDELISEIYAYRERHKL